MKPHDWDQEQMQFWKLRRPSQGLERRIFGTVAAQPHPRRIPGLGWLVPAACLCVITVQLAINHPAAGVSASMLSPGMFTASGLNQLDLSAYAPGWSHSERNGLTRDTFEWTNGTPAPSTTRTLPVMLSLTNSLFD